MRTQLRIFLSLIFILSLAGCAAGQATPSSTDTPATDIPQTTAEVDYTLLNLKIGTGGKCVLDIRLPEKISADEITQIANELRENEGAGCTPLFIFYYLPGGEVKYEKAWAYSHFNPDLEVKISEP